MGVHVPVVSRRLFGWDLCRHAQGSEGEWVDIVVQHGEQCGEVSMRVAEVLGMALLWSRWCLASTWACMSVTRSVAGDDMTWWCMLRSKGFKCGMDGDHE